MPFDRDKLMRSLQVALRKRPVDPERVEKMVSAVVRELESGGEAEISSEAIGEIVMEHLRQLDDVAYVRFASVYRNFREAKDFEAVLGELSGDDEAAAGAVAQVANCATIDPEWLVPIFERDGARFERLIRRRNPLRTRPYQTSDDFRRPSLHAACADPRSARARPHLAEPGRRLAGGQGRRRARPRLDP